MLQLKLGLVRVVVVFIFSLEAYSDNRALVLQSVHQLDMARALITHVQ